MPSPVFLHVNEVSSCILIRYRFTNERHSTNCSIASFWSVTSSVNRAFFRHSSASFSPKIKDSSKAFKACLSS